MEYLSIYNNQDDSSSEDGETNTSKIKTLKTDDTQQNYNVSMVIKFIYFNYNLIFMFYWFLLEI